MLAQQGKETYRALLVTAPGLTRIAEGKQTSRKPQGTHSFSAARYRLGTGETSNFGTEEPSASETSALYAGPGAALHHHVVRLQEE